VQRHDKSEAIVKNKANTVSDAADAWVMSYLLSDGWRERPTGHDRL